jgi:hypothetical protein
MSTVEQTNFENKDPIIDNNNSNDNDNDNDNDDNVMEFLMDTCVAANQNDTPEGELDNGKLIIPGIDLGTTNSCISIWRNNNCEIIPDEFGNKPGDDRSCNIA